MNSPGFFRFVRETFLCGLLAGMASCGSDTSTRHPNDVTPAKPTAPAVEGRVGGVGRSYPPTRRENVKDVLHSVEVLDPYRWLEDGKSAEVQRWAHAQDDFARSELSKIPLRNALATRLKAIARHDEKEAPTRIGARLFYRRRSADRERWAVYYREGSDEKEQVLLDPDSWAPDRRLSLGEWTVSWDGTKVAYQVKERNADSAVVRVMDVASHKVSDVDVVDGAEDPWVQWTPKGDGFYYQRLSTDPALHAKRYELAEARFHKLGDDPKHDAIVRAPSPGQSSITLTVGPDGHWLICSVLHGWSKNDVYFEDLREAQPTWRSLAVGRDARTDVSAYRDTFYVRSLDGAPNGEVFAVDPRKPERASWRRLVPERPDSPLMGLRIVGGHLIARYRHDVVAQVEIRNLDGTLLRALPLHGVGTTGFPVGTPDGDEAYYYFESYDRPAEIYKTSISTGLESAWSKTALGATLSGIEVEQVFYKSKDGTRVPMFVVHPRGMKHDGTAPAILYGYGGFNYPLVPQFLPDLIPWVERGGVFAIANLRGGSEYGEAWHRAGMRHEKQNVFDDFIAGAEYLIHEKFTRSDRLASSGRSNGGLLVAATLTQRPELFRAVLCTAPATDMVRLSLFNHEPDEELGTPGNPDDFRALFAYSPYHHVRPGTAYPSVLISTSDVDEQADPMHARKFAAALQSATTGGAVLLRTEWDTGHMGSDSVSRQAEATADEYAFALDAMGLARNP